MNSLGMERAGRMSIVWDILRVSFLLGLTSFGGPVAHLGYFHDTYVRRKKWIDEQSYADLVALCQFLPGPASSQVGIGIGSMRAGIVGGIAAWIGFTLPSAVVLVLFAMFVQGMEIGASGWLHGLKLTAVAVVAQAILGMGRTLTPDRTRITMAAAAAAVVLLWPTSISQLGILAVAAVIGCVWFSKTELVERAKLDIPVSRKVGALSLALFALLLVGLPVLRGLFPQGWLALTESFYRSGALVFGGGHVVLPLLEREVVPAGWVSQEVFLAGYGAAQSVPGPLFTFASYLGAAYGGWTGAVVATGAIFLPAFLLVVGALPFWNALRDKPKVQGALKGVNAAVVGILLAAFYNPLWTSSISRPVDFAFTVILFVLLAVWKLPPWIVVLTGALGGMALAGGFR